MNLIKSLIILLNLIIILVNSTDHIEYRSYESSDKIFIKSLNSNDNNNNDNNNDNNQQLKIKDGIQIELNENTPSSIIISHSHTSKYKRNLFSSELFKRGGNTEYDIASTQDNIESIQIYFNNNYLEGEFSRNHFKDDQIDSSLSTTSGDNSKFINYPIILEPTITVLVRFKEGSNEIKMEHYSTIKTLTFNQTYSICKVIESILDMSIQPCSVKESDIFENFLHMGLVPEYLNLPWLYQSSKLEFNDLQSKTTNVNRLRFLQSSKFNTTSSSSSSSSSNEQHYSSLLNSKSYVNCLSIFNHHKLCGNRKVNYLVENDFNQFLGFNLEITQDTIHFNEMSLLSSLSKDNNNNRINIQYIKDEKHLNQDPEQKHNTMITLINQNEKELYQLDKSKVQLLAKDIINQQSKSPSSDLIELIKKEWSIIKLNRSIKKSGFHRELVSNITLRTPSTLKIPRQCKLLLLEHFDQGIFVDRYEVDEIERFGGPTVNIYQLIDLEKPSATSTQNYISIIKEFTVSTDIEQSIEITLPIHLRYQNPISSDSDAYRSSHISSPNIFIQCEPSNSVHQSDQKSLDHWQLINNFNNNNPVNSKSLFIDVPVGQLKDLDNVKFNTLLVTVIGSILVVLTIIKTQRKLINEKSKKK